MPQVHAPLTGALPDLHKTQVVVVVASHLLHPLTDVKHSLPLGVPDDDFVQAVLAALRSYPLLHAVHVVSAEQVLQLSMQPLQTFPFK